MGVSSVALMDKADKMMAVKTPKGLFKKKEKAVVGGPWAVWRGAARKGRFVVGAGGAGGKGAFKSLLRPGVPRTGLLPAAPRPRGREDFNLWSCLTSFTGSGEEGGEVGVRAVTHPRKPQEGRRPQDKQGE